MTSTAARAHAFRRSPCSADRQPDAEHDFVDPAQFAKQLLMNSSHGNRKSGSTRKTTYFPQSFTVTLLELRQEEDDEGVVRQHQS